MTVSPSVRTTHPDLAVNQGERKPLLADSYDVLASDGRFICRATREQAAEAIAAGIAEGIGRTCVKYLRIRRLSSPVPNAGSRTTRRVRNDQYKALGGSTLQEHRWLGAKHPFGPEDQSAKEQATGAPVTICPFGVPTLGALSTIHRYRETPPICTHCGVRHFVPENENRPVLATPSGQIFKGTIHANRNTKTTAT